VLLITGIPGIGKTTVIRRVAEVVKAEGLRGFYTEEIRESGKRRGFRLVGFDKSARVIAHVDLPKRQRVGRYGVDVQAIDEAAWTKLARWNVFPSASSRQCVSLQPAVPR
jgi:nucleoside-triphosphatase